MSRFYELKGEQCQHVRQLLEEKQKGWKAAIAHCEKKIGVKELTLVHSGAVVTGFCFPGVDPENPNPELLKHDKPISKKVGDKVFSFDRKTKAGRAAAAELAAMLRPVPSGSTIMSYLKLNPFYTSPTHGLCHYTCGADVFGKRVVLSLPAPVKFDRKYAVRISDLVVEKLQASKKTKKPKKAASTA